MGIILKLMIVSIIAIIITIIEYRKYIFLLYLSNVSESIYNKIIKEINETKAVVNKYLIELKEKGLTKEESEDKSRKLVEACKYNILLADSYELFYLNFLIIRDKYSYKHIYSSKYKKDLERISQKVFESI